MRESRHKEMSELATRAHPLIWTSGAAVEFITALQDALNEALREVEVEADFPLFGLFSEEVTSEQGLRRD